MGMLIACREGCRPLPDWWVVHGEWFGPVAAALVNDSQSADIWLEGPPNSPVGLGSQAVCVPFISVTCEIPRSPSRWSEAETACVWREVHFPAVRVPGMEFLRRGWEGVYFWDILLK